MTDLRRYRGRATQPTLSRLRVTNGPRSCVVAIAVVAGLGATGPAWADAEAGGLDLGASVAPKDQFAPWLVVLDFDGETLTQAPYAQEDSRTSRSAVCGGTSSPFGTGSITPEAVQSELESIFSGFNVRFTTTRPTTGDYTLAVFGKTTCNFPSDSGIAGLYCGRRPNNIVFAFLDANYYGGARTAAKIMAQEIAHGFGLAHVSEPTDLLSSRVGKATGFLDQCFPTMPPDPCASQHQTFCPSGGQNSRKELMALLGTPGAVMEAPPVVRITSPMSGATFAAPATFDVTAEVEAKGDVAAQLLVNGQPAGGTVPRAPYVFPAMGVPGGMYSLVVSATDAAGQVGMSLPVVVQVGAEGGSSTSGTPPSSSTTGQTTTGSTATTAASVGTTGAPVGTAGSGVSGASSAPSTSAAPSPLADEEQGCACGPKPGDLGRSHHALSWVFGVGVAFRRVRRSLPRASGPKPRA